MRVRDVPFVLGLIVPSLLIGCTGSGNLPAVPPGTKASTPAPRPTTTPHIEIQSLTADQLAQIVGVNVWTARYSGGPIECWLEIEEEGQSTLPKRIPEKGSVGVNPEGSVLLWWTRREDRQGGQLALESGGGFYGHSLNKDAFTFGWSGFGAQVETIGNGELKEGEPGKEFVVIDYDARESLQGGDKKMPRRVHLKLMGRFPVQK